MPPEDREELDRFLEDVYYLLEEAGVARFSEWLTPELREHFAAAWREAGAAFADTRVWVRSEDSDESLAIVGLTGVQLRLKLRGYWLSRERFAQRPTRGLLRRLLRWTDVLLGSLAAAFPPAELIKELKEALEVDLEGENA